jgi:hypothetical protein
MIEKRPKLADIEITAGYIELKGSEDLEDPTIKNWVRDYVAHLGYERHSQMQRTQYLFHSENGRNLNSPDREKLGIILKSFDENVALPVDEENGEIVFDTVEQKSPSNSPFFKEGETTGSFPFAKGEKPIQNFPLSQRGIKRDFEKAAIEQESFVKPYAPEPRPRPIPPIAQPEEFVQPNMVTQPSRKIIPPPNNQTTRQPDNRLDKYFNIPESPDIPPIKIHSITEHNEPKPAPPIPPRPALQHPGPPPAPAEPRPQHRIINPFEPRIVEPKIEGNIVDLSDK